MTTTDADQRQQSYFRDDFKSWLKQRPNGTLGELRDWLKEAYDQCSDMVMMGDPPIETTEDIPEELDEYLGYWGEHDGECFSYREVQIEEDIMNCDEFIEDHGRETKLSSFPVFEVA